MRASLQREGGWIAPTSIDVSCSIEPDLPLTPPKLDGSHSRGLPKAAYADWLLIGNPVQS
jgi:hypothetical protein